MITDFKGCFEATEMVQWVKLLLAQSDNLSNTWTPVV